MATYRQYCPIARATEILAERWSLLIVRNLMFGATTFSAIAQGVPTMSRSMLTKRLRELERAGVITATAKPNGQGSLYALTDAGADLADVIGSLGRWAETWVDVLPEHADPGFALWAWCMVQLDSDAVPETRVVVAFEFPEERAGNRFFWLLIQDGRAEVCTTDPGGEADVHVVARSAAFVDWHRGARSWAQAVRSGDIAITGERSLVRAFPDWNTRVPVVA
ncbi:MAG: helix-turn-helix domain-containing protein [Acidimicrobiales bacterium]|nr:helix-turn-helix domain-containing protein [Acidimicrobiales bacterium]